MWLRGMSVLLILLCSSILYSTRVYADTTPQTTTQIQDTASAEEEKRSIGQIIGILCIFTVTCGVTAYVVMRPSLKKLRDVRNNGTSKGTKSDNRNNSL